MTGEPWLHLRIRLEYGKISCRGSSPNHHASPRARHDRHPVIRSLERGKERSFFFVDEVGVGLAQVRGETQPPLPQLV